MKKVALAAAFAAIASTATYAGNIEAPIIEVAPAMPETVVVEEANSSSGGGLVVLLLLAAVIAAAAS